MFVLGMGWASTSPVEHSGVCVPLSLLSPGSICGGAAVSLSCCTLGSAGAGSAELPHELWAGLGSGSHRTSPRGFDLGQAQPECSALLLLQRLWWAKPDLL